MQKLYYSISEVCEIIDEEQHILRYWEKEFPQLKPRKNRGGNRIYSEKDIYTIRMIKQLLRNDNLSLKTARTQLNYLIQRQNEENLFSSIEKSQNLAGFKHPPNSLKQSKSKKKATITFNKNEAVELMGVLKELSAWIRQIEG
jgi:DNA-binding transcriptional MerR regulator